MQYAAHVPIVEELKRHVKRQKMPIFGPIDTGVTVVATISSCCQNVDRFVKLGRREYLLVTPNGSYRRDEVSHFTNGHFDRQNLPVIDTRAEGAFKFAWL